MDDVKQVLVERARIAKPTSEAIRSAPRSAIPDEAELLLSLNRLIESGFMFGIHEKQQRLRVIAVPAHEHFAILDGFSIWSPRDMFEYIHLPPDQRRQLREFKRVFGAGGFDWENLRKDV